MPKTDTSDKEPEPYPESDTEGPVKVLELSAKHPQFACSRIKANHIAQWLNHVNNVYEPTEQGSVISEVTSTLRGDLDDALSVQETPDDLGLTCRGKKDNKKVVQKDQEKKKTEKESPKKDLKGQEETEKPKDKLSPSQKNDTTQSNKVTQSSEAINQEKTKNELRKTRPPLKKVKTRKRTTSSGNNSNNSSTRPSLSSPTKTNIFTPFGQLETVNQPQSEVRKEQGNATGTPMNIDKAGTSLQKFSTPFLKSPTGTGITLQGFFSTPISTGTFRNSFSPPIENNFQNQPSLAGEFSPQSISQLQGKNHFNFEPTQEMSSEQMNLNALQPDSGFDEVIDMDVDNFEQLTETIKAEVSGNV